MIFTGKQKSLVDEALDFSYNPQWYATKASDLQSMLFPETKYGMRFLPFVLETIKKSHPTLPYILRQQYREADSVFIQVLRLPSHIARDQEESFCNSIFDRLRHPSVQQYYQDVCKFLIHPFFKRFAYFSPYMSVCLFVGLMCYLGENYESQYYGLVWKHFSRGHNAYNVQRLRHLLDAAADSTETRMIEDELMVWSA